MLIFDNRVKVTTTTKPNASADFDWTGASAASGGFILPAAMRDPTTGILIATSDTFPYAAFADNLFECGIATLLSGGVTASRASTVISNSSGTQARIDFSGATDFPAIIVGWDAMMARSGYNLLRPQIYGENLTYTSATAFGAAGGCSWIEGMDAAPYAASYANLTGQTGTAANFYNVFKSMVGGVPTLSKVIAGTAGSTNPPVPFALGAGTARSKAGDPLSRYLGTILYGATDVIRPFRMTDKGGGTAEVFYLADTTAAAPFLLFNQPGSAGAPTSFTPLNLSGLIPNNGTAVDALLCVDIATDVTAPGAGIRLSLDGTGYMALLISSSAIQADALSSLWVPINPTTTSGIYYEFTDADAGASIFCWGYRFRR